MTFALRWKHPAVADLLAIPSWRAAARVDAAIIAFASLGEGEVTRHPTDSSQFRLRVQGYVVYLRVDRESRLIEVLRVFRR